MSKNRHFIVEYQGKLVGKRSSPTMAYTHAVVWYNEGFDSPEVKQWCLTERNAERARSDWSRRLGTDTLYVVPVTEVDKRPA